jgi:hypothetical protein
MVEGFSIFKYNDVLKSTQSKLGELKTKRYEKA